MTLRRLGSSGHLALWNALSTVGVTATAFLVTVTTARKAFTLLASFILFPKHLGWGHPIGAALVLGSVFVVRKPSAPKNRESLLPQHQTTRSQ